MKKIYLAALAGNLGSVSIGMTMGWASPALPLISNDNTDYPVHLNLEETSWVASLPVLGSLVGFIITALIVNVIGRKITMLFSAIPSAIGWLMIVFATSSWELYISRFISGLSIGFTMSSTAMYLGEISPADIRGNLASMLTVAVQLGVLIEYIIGSFLSVRNLALISLAGPCLFVVAFVWLPESPYHFMRCDVKQKAINSLVRLRGNEDVFKEADRIEQSVKADLANKAGFRELLFVPGNRKALITLLGVGMIQQLSGSQAVIQYAQTIFDEANSNLEGKYLTMILGLVFVVCSIVCMIVTDYSGRKSLLMISIIGSACSTAMVATYFHLQYNHVDISNITWLPATGVILYSVMHSLGLSPLLMTLASELFSTNVKALGTMIGGITMGISAFFVVKLFPIISEDAGVHTPFWIFTACSIAGALFTLLYVPETKGRTLEQIQEGLHGLSGKNEDKRRRMEYFHESISPRQTFEEYGIVHV